MISCWKACIIHFICRISGNNNKKNVSHSFPEPQLTLQNAKFRLRHWESKIKRFISRQNSCYTFLFSVLLCCFLLYNHASLPCPSQVTWGKLSQPSAGGQARSLAGCLIIQHDLPSSRSVSSRVWLTLSSLTQIFHCNHNLTRKLTRPRCTGRVLCESIMLTYS